MNQHERKLIQVYLRAETDIINEIARLRSLGLADYHAVAALRRVRRILSWMQSEAWTYAPKAIEEYFYANRPELRIMPTTPEMALRAYESAAALTIEQVDIVSRLTFSLMASLENASDTVAETLGEYLVGRRDFDLYRSRGIAISSEIEAEGSRRNKVDRFVKALQRDGITAFEDKAGRKWRLHTYASMVTRTTTRQAEVLSVLTKDPTQDLYTIKGAADPCGVCAAYQDRVYSKSGEDPRFPPLSDIFGKIDPDGPNTLQNTWLNIHPNCLVPGGFVLAEGVMAHSARDYDGEIITLETSRGNKISVTPNHPILTTKGFIFARDLQEGDKVIETTPEYAAFLGKAPDNIDVPTAVEEIGNSIMQSRGGTACRVEGSTVQFHGDGVPNSKVDIVFSDCFIENERYPVFNKKFRETSFPSAFDTWCALLPNSSSLQVCLSPFHPSYRIMGGGSLVNGVKKNALRVKNLCNVGALHTTHFRNSFLRKPLIVQFHEALKLFDVRCGERGCDPLCARNESIVGHNCFDIPCAYSELFSNLRVVDPVALEGLKKLLSENILVISELFHKSTSIYSGKVYNLETKYGFYTYNTIITHNCRCALIPWTEAGRSPEEIEKIRRFSDPRLNPYDKDPRTEQAIKAYHRQEDGRRKWLEDYKQWERYRVTIPDKTPKTFNTFMRHKALNDDKYKAWEREYRAANEEARDA